MYLLYCISQKSFHCFLSGYHPSIVSNIENGNTKLSLIALINIANALEVTTDVLLCDSTYKSKAVLHDDLAELLEVADDDDVRQIVAYAQFWMETGRKINRKGE